MKATISQLERSGQTSNSEQSTDTEDGDKANRGGNEGIPLLLWGSLAGRAKPVMTRVEWMAQTAPGSQSQGLCSQKKKGNAATLLTGCLSFKNKSRIPLSHAHFYTVLALF